MKRLFYLICLFASYAMLCITAGAETSLSVCINELCSSNGGHYTIGGNTPDYVELRNLTDQTLSLDGFFISNDEDHPQKFSLNGYSIPENGYIILAADKKELPFKLSASGDELFLSDANGNVLQHIILPPLEKDETYSLQQSGEWQLTDPTPLSENTEGTPYVEKVYVASPRFSHEAGFYDDPFDLTLEGYKTYKLYYTTDGSVPDENATLYTGPIHIEDATNHPNTLSMRTDVTVNGATPPSDLIKKATIIRAVAIDPDGNRSNDVVKTYFVGFQNYKAYQNIPILSIVADPYDLFDEQDGIYVLGKAYQEWLNDENRDKEMLPQWMPANYQLRGKASEISVVVQWFSAENALRLSQDAGLRIHGNFARADTKKSFNLYARKEYGSDTFQYDILTGLTGKQKLVVRATLGSDALLHALLRETGLPVSSYKPCLTFVNGEFWGLYEIREKQDEKDIAGYFDMSPKDLLVIKNGDLISGTTPEDVIDKTEKGVYRELRKKISNLDLSTPQGYKESATLIDVDNYITYMAGITYLNNTDYRSNYTLWRTAKKGDSEYQDSRWRWIFQDLDDCCANYEGARVMIPYLPEDTIFSSFWKNSSFQTKFLTRIMDFANVELTPEYVQDFITPILTYYNPYLRETYVRFPGKNSSISKPGTKQISTLMSFFKTRRDAVIQQLTDTFMLTQGTSTISLNNLTDGIALEINGHQAHIYGDSWTGVYFKDCNVCFTAGDIPGYQFAGWYTGDQLITEERTVEISTNNNSTLTPLYTEIPVIATMNEKETLYGSERFGFVVPVKDSEYECTLKPDAALKVKRNYINNTISFQLSESAESSQGVTLTVPLRNYYSAGVVIMLLRPKDTTPMEWKIRCRIGENLYQEVAMDEMELPGERLRLSFVLPEEPLDNQDIDIRLETDSRSGSFSLCGFRIYGVPMDDSMAQAYEYARMVKAIGADNLYSPNIEQMESWSTADVEAEIVSLRKKLQTAMTEKALSSVGNLGSNPAWEGLEAYTVVTIDEKLIQAFYNEGAIDFPCSVGKTVYLYELLNGTLLLHDTVTVDDGVISLSKRAGTFFLLDKPLENIRFSASFDKEEIPESLLSSAFFNIPPQNHLWMNIETITRYQEEVSFDLTDDWSGNHLFLYRDQDENLTFWAEASVANGTFCVQPVSGRYLILDESLESFAEQADWARQEIADQERIQAQENAKQAKMKKTLIIIGGSVFIVIAIGIVLANIYRKRK